MKKPFVMFIILSFLTLSSCATLEEHKGAATGAAVGAGLGGLIGAAVAPGGHGLAGAIIGGLAGGLIGGAVGHYAFDTKRTQTETNKAYGYTPDKGSSVRIESIDVKPKTVKAGGKLDTNLTYAVLTPSNEGVNIKEIREIWYGDSLWGNPETTVSRQGGTYQSNIPIFLPSDIKKGTYKVRYIVQTDFSKDMREASFTVN